MSPRKETKRESFRKEEISDWPGKGTPTPATSANNKVLRGGGGPSQTCNISSISAPVKERVQVCKKDCSPVGGYLIGRFLIILHDYSFHNRKEKEGSGFITESESGSGLADVVVKSKDRN